MWRSPKEQQGRIIQKMSGIQQCIIAHHIHEEKHEKLKNAR